MLAREGALNIGIRDGAFADDGPVVAIDTHNGRGQDGARIAGIEDERQAIVELLDDLLCVGAGRKTGKICAGAGDGPADGVNQRGGDARIGPTERDAAAIAGDFQRKAMSGVNDDRESARPEFVRESKKRVRNIAHERDGLLDGVDQNRERFRFRAAFNAEDFLDGREIERIGGESVEGIRGHADHTAAADEAGGVVHHRRLGSCG